MSSVYATEPATAGRVILETTDGPLEIHLWCRECPQTTRVFLQLCMDGFYDNMVFHRIMANFLIQTGALRHASVAPTPSMSSPEGAAYRKSLQAAQALDRRPYEINSRIRFNHRGQVAMALGLDDNDDVEDLQPQFFITLDDAPYLDGKHVVFGTVSGPTIFNALRIARVETDEATHQPVDLPNATRIKSVKIVENPIHEGLTPHTNPPWKVIAKAVDSDKPKKKTKKRKGKFDTNVLSFGTEFEEDTAIPSKTKKEMHSSHDVVESKQGVEKVEDDDKSGLDSDRFSSKKQPMDLEQGESSSKPSAEQSSIKHHKIDEQEELQRKESQKGKPKEDNSMPHIASNETANTIASKPSLVEARRLKYAKAKKSKKEREEETLKKLMAFRSTLQHLVEERKSARKGGPELPQQDDSLAARMMRRAEKAKGTDATVQEDEAPTYHGQVLDSDDDDKNGDVDSRKWLATVFKCKKHVDHASRNLGEDGRDADDYEVIDSTREGHKHRRHHHRDDKKSRKHEGSKHRHRK